MVNKKLEECFFEQNLMSVFTCFLKCVFLLPICFTLLSVIVAVKVLLKLHTYWYSFSEFFLLKVLATEQIVV